MERIQLDVDISGPLQRVNQLQAQITGLSRAKITLDASSLDTALSKVNQLQAALSRIQSPNINLNVDTSAVDKINGEKIQLDVEANTQGAQSDIETLGGDKVTLDIDGDTAAAQGEVDTLTGQQLTLDFDGDTTAAQGEVDALVGQQLVLPLDIDTAAAQGEIDALEPPPPMQVDITGVLQIAPPTAADFSAAAVRGGAGGFDPSGLAGGGLTGFLRGGFGTAGSSLAQGTAAGVGAAAGIAIARSIGEAKDQMVGLVEATADYEKGIREVASLQVPGLGLEEVDADAKELNKTLGISTEQIIPALYQAASIGIGPESLIPSLEQNSKLAKAGLADLQPTLLLTSSALINYKDQNLNLTDASEALFATVSNGILRLPGLAQNMGAIIPIAASMGVSFNDLNAAMATSSKQTLNVARTTTGLRGLIAELGRETSKSGKTFEKLTGQSLRDYLAQTDEAGNKVHHLSDAIVLMNQYADQQGTSLANLFSNRRAADAALQLASGNVTLLKEQEALVDSAVKKGREGDSALERAFAINEDSVRARIRRLVAQFEGIKLNIGAPILKEVGTVVEFMTSKALPAVVGFVKSIDFTPITKNIGPAASAFGDLVKSVAPLVAGGAFTIITAGVQGLGVMLNVVTPLFRAIASEVNSLVANMRQAAGATASFLDAIPPGIANLVGFGGNIDKAQASLRAFADGTSLAVTGTDTLIRKTSDQTDVEKAATATREAGADSLVKAAGALGDEADAADEASEAIKRVDTAWAVFAQNIGLTTQETLANAHHAINDFVDATKGISLKKILDQDGNFDQNTEAGLKAFDAFDALRQQQVKFSEDLASGKIKQDQYLSATQLITDAVEKQAQKMGANKDQVADLKREFATPPPPVNLELGITVDNHTLQASLERIQAFSQLDVKAKLGFDTDNNGVVSAKELGIDYGKFEWRAKLGYKVDDETYKAALKAGEDWAVSKFTAELAFAPPGTTIGGLTGATVRPTKKRDLAEGAVLSGPTWLPYLDGMGRRARGGEAGLEVIAPVGNMRRTVDLYRQAGALDRLANELIARGVVAPVNQPGPYMAAGPVVAPVINLSVPKDMNQEAYAKEGIRQMRAAAAATTLRAMRSGVPRGGVRT